MPAYVALYKLTTKGASDIRKSPERMQDAVKAWEAMGGKTHTVLATMGQYDFVSVGEAPSDEVAATFALALASQANVTIETLRAFTAEEFTAMAASLL
jgi:uncharacterized protein with GYD domain